MNNECFHHSSFILSSALPLPSDSSPALMLCSHRKFTMPNYLNLAGAIYPAYNANNPSFSNDTSECVEKTVQQLIHPAIRAQANTPAAVYTSESIM
jgi:hypothetical protein